MKILFDTNVVVDLLLEREPFAEPAVHLFTHIARGDLKGCLCATTITTIYFLVGRVSGRRQARQHVRELSEFMEVAPVDRHVIAAALIHPMNDFEDAVLYEAACRAGATGIVTRNGRDFRRCDLRVFSPVELLDTLSAS